MSRARLGFESRRNPCEGSTHRLHLVRHQARVADVLRIEVRFIHNRAVFEKQDPIGIGGDARVVRHHYYGGAGSQGMMTETS